MQKRSKETEIGKAKTKSKDEVFNKAKYVEKK